MGTTGDERGAPHGERLVTKPFLLITGVTFLFFLYVGVQVPLIPRLIEEHLGGHEFDIGLNLAVFSLTAIAIRPLLGPWGDRYGRRALMIGGGVLAGVGALLAALVQNKWVLLPVRAMCGMGEGSLFVGAATMITDIAPAHRRAEAASYFSVAVFGGLGVGPIIGESVTGDTHFARGLVVAGVFALIAAGAALVLPVVRMAPAQPGDAADEGPHHLFHRAAFRPGAVLALGIGGFATFNAFMPEHAKTAGLHSAEWVFAVYSVVCLVIRLVGARWPERVGLPRSVLGALGLLAGGLALLAAFVSKVGVFGGTTLIGLGMAFLYPSLMAMTVNAVSDAERSRVMSTFTMFFEVGSALGGILFGVVAQITSKRGGFLGGAISALIGLVVMYRFVVPLWRHRPISASEVVRSPAH